MWLMRENRRKEERVRFCAGGTHRKGWVCSARSREKKKGRWFALGAHKNRSGVAENEQEKRRKGGGSRWGLPKKGSRWQCENKRKEERVRVHAGQPQGKG